MHRNAAVPAADQAASRRLGAAAPRRRLISRRGRRRSLLLFIILLAAPLAFADSDTARRTDAGVRMFSTLLAADLNLQQKTIDDGKLLVVIYYTNDGARAQQLGEMLRAKTIGGRPVHVETTTDPAFKSYDRRAPAGIFLSQPPDAKTLKSIIQYGIARHLIVYSPFEGHVESGVLGGLSIGAQVRPYVNLPTLQASQITLKPIFMKVMKVYP